MDTIITIVYKEAMGHPHFWFPKEMDLGLLGRCDGLELSCANQKWFLAKKNQVQLR